MHEHGSKAKSIRCWPFFASMNEAVTANEWLVNLSQYDKNRKSLAEQANGRL
jgi:hypothetical protein